MNLSDLRRDFGAQGQNEEPTPENPFELFENWLTKAIQFPLSEANAMVLSTVDTQNRPFSRVVLLKAFNEQKGFVFYTDYGSQKARDLAQNPYASLLFFWPTLERQIRIEGIVEKTSRPQSVAYFNSRPPESRASAIVSHQSKPINHWERLRQRQKDLLNGDKPLFCPERWGGYRLKPHRFEFWQGGISRLHHRLVYQLNESRWKTEILAP